MMSLKKYDELTEAEKQKVKVMYSDQSTVQNYLYNFDGEKYIGRQFYIPEQKDEKFDFPTGTVHAEPLKEFFLEANEKTVEVPLTDEEYEKIHPKEITGKTEPVKRVKQSKKK